MKIVYVLMLLVLVGCEKAVNFTLKDQEPKLVVEASIENGGPPIVILSKSLNYFSQITPQELSESFVHDAVIVVSNGVKSHTLKEFQVPVSANYNAFYYSLDPAQPATAFTGDLNTTYSLTISSGGKQYNATTSIPSFNKGLDSLWWKERPGDTSIVSVFLKATDPPGFGNYVRYYTKRNSDPFLPGFASVYDDLVIDGTTYQIEVEPGSDRNADLNSKERAFRRGDTVTLKLSGIDKATYDFWRTMEYTYASVGNPFSSPIKVTTNITGGALGYFGGYASQYATVVIPR